MGALGKQKPKPTASWSYPDGKELTLPSPAGAAVLSGSNSLLVRDVCVAFTAVAGPGDFFLHLKRKETRNGPVFRVGRKVVISFPDKTSIFVHTLSGGRCSIDRPFKQAVVPPLDLLRSPRAEAAYVRDMELHPLQISLADEGRSPISYLRDDRIWSYHFVVETKGLKLTDALVISLFLRDGTKVGQFSWRQ